MLARKTATDNRGGFSWRKSMMQFGSYHKQQLAQLSHKLRMARTPYWERAVIIDDFLRDVMTSRSDMRSRYKKMRPSRKKKMHALYRRNLSLVEKQLGMRREERWN